MPLSTPSAATTSDIARITGRDVRAQINGGRVVQYNNISLTVKSGEFQSDSSEAEFDQKVVGKRSAEGELEFELGNDVLPDNLPAIDDEITGLYFTITSGHVMPAGLDDPTKFGKCRVRTNALKVENKINTYRQSISWGFID